MLRQLRTEQQLVESEARLAGIVDSAKDAIIAIEQDQRITLFNAAAERMFGCSAAEARGRSLGGFIPHFATPGRSENVGTTRAPETSTDEPASCELGIRSSGERFPIEISVSRVEAGGRDLITMIVRDITERKRAEMALHEKDEHLRQAQKMEALGTLAGGVAHEFNNLLQVIQGYTRYALEGLSGDGERSQDLEQVLKAAGRAAVLTAQLLGFGRRQMLQLVDVDPNQLVADCVNMLRPLIGQHIELEMALGQNVGPIHVDPAQLHQVLMNLCINARDAMPEGGTLLLETRSGLAPCDEKSPGARVGAVITVSDTGSGMAPDVKRRIFEPFFTTKGPGKGTGLGLAVAYSIVQQHHGILEIDSEPGHGSTFTLCIPTVEVASARVLEERDPSFVGGSECILVAEDEPLVLDLAIRILRGAGYRTVAARSGEEAVQIFESQPGKIDLAVLDVNMRKVSGHEAFRRIQALQPGTPVVFCSGYDPETTHADFVSNEGLTLVQKPFEPWTLLSAIRAALNAAHREQVAASV